jgi:hypothetical protein
LTTPLRSDASAAGSASISEPAATAPAGTLPSARIANPTVGATGDASSPR